MFICFNMFPFSFFAFLTGDSFVALKCVEILLPQLAQYWIYRHEPPCLSRSDIINALVTFSQL